MSPTGSLPLCGMLAYLDAQQGKEYVVIFDDLKRFARDVEFHIKLRREFADRGARIECLNFAFEDTPEGKFIETIIAAQGELEREQNRRQVKQKMMARVEKGYWVFHAPVGYKFETNRIHGKLLAPDEPVAECLREALNGYANGRFGSQAEVQRFLESQPEFPKDQPNGKIRAWKITKILRNPIYAGHVQAKKWGVSLRRGHHEPLISYSTHEQILRNLKEGARPAARADFSPDFPLRGHVHCSACGNAARFEECMELALRFLSRPWDIYKNGSYAVRQTVLRLAFSEPLKFTPEGVYGTPKTTLPFRVLGGLFVKKCEMVLLERIELSTSPLPRECSTSELQQRRARRDSPKPPPMQAHSGRQMPPALQKRHGR